MQKKLWSKEFIAIIGSSLFMSWAFHALMPTLPLYLIETLKMDNRAAGLIIAGFAVTAVLVRPYAGYLLDNYRRSRVLTISLFLITAAYGMYPLMGGVLAILLLRLAHGAMWGTCTSGSATVAADIVPPSRIGQGIGIYALAIPIGMTIGPVFGLELLKRQGPDAMFFAVAGVSFLSIVCAFHARTPFKPAVGRKFSAGSLFQKKALPFSSCMFFIMITYSGIVVYAGLYAAQKGFSNVAAFFLCHSAATFLSRLFAGRSFDKGHILQMVLLGLGLAAVGLLWLGYAGNPTQFLLAGAVSGLGFGILMPTCQAAVNNMVKSEERGAANSTYLISYDLGFGAGVFLIGLISGKVSLGEIYRYSVCSISLAAALFIFTAIPHYRRNRPQAPSGRS